jgi:hypothetical protein
MTQIPKQFQRGFKYPVLDQDLPGTQQKLDPPPLSDITADGKPYKAAGKLEGKKAIVTAGDSGIGRSVALLYGTHSFFLFQRALSLLNFLFYTSA